MEQSEEIQNENDEMEESAYELPEVKESVLAPSEKENPVDGELRAKIMEELKNLPRKRSHQMFHMATPQHGNKNRGVGITRKSKEKTKKAVKLAKKQRATNNARSNKKFRATGSKQRK